MKGIKKTAHGGWGPHNKVGAKLLDSLGPASNLEKIFYAHTENYTQKKYIYLNLFFEPFFTVYFTPSQLLTSDNPVSTYITLYKCPRTIILTR